MKWVRGLVLLMLVLWIGVGYFAVRVFLPINPVAPYFLPSVSAVANLHWPMARFQPVYLWKYNKNDGVFFKVAYRDGSQKIRLADVFVGGKWIGEDYLALATNSSLHFGERIEIVYLEDTKTITLEQQQIRSGMCGAAPRLCQIALYVEKTGGFPLININMQIPKGVVIPAMGVSEVTEKK